MEGLPIVVSAGTDGQIQIEVSAPAELVLVNVIGTPTQPVAGEVKRAVSEHCPFISWLMKRKSREIKGKHARRVKRKTI